MTVLVLHLPHADDEQKYKNITTIKKDSIKLWYIAKENVFTEEYAEKGEFFKATAWSWWNGNTAISPDFCACFENIVLESDARQSVLTRPPNY